MPNPRTLSVVLALVASALAAQIPSRLKASGSKFATPKVIDETGASHGRQNQACSTDHESAQPRVDPSLRCLQLRIDLLLQCILCLLSCLLLCFEARP